MQISMLLDIIISVLLILTIAYAVRLNHRLSQLRSDKNELLQLAKTFAEATTRAESGIERLKVSTEALGIEVAKAEALKDDLAYLVDRGGRTADEMVDTVRAPARSGSKKDSPARKPGLGGGQTQNADDEARLIEEAILAATPGSGAKKDKNPQPFEGTRRITGRLGSERKKSNFESSDFSDQRLPSSRDLGGDDGEKSIGDTAAARELLKALGGSDK